MNLHEALVVLAGFLIASFGVIVYWHRKMR